MKLFYFDVETTGTHQTNDDIWQIAGMVEVDGKVIDAINIKMKPRKIERIPNHLFEMFNTTKEEMLNFPSREEGFDKLVTFFSKHTDIEKREDSLIPAGHNAAAFDMGFNGVVTLPPYYYHQASIDGIYAWFKELITQAVPGDGYLLGYHIPAQSRVPLPLDLLSNLKDSFPSQFAGIKDSSGDPKHTEALAKRFGKDLVVLIGSDSLLSHSLENQGSGCITALANLYSSGLRTVWDAYQQGKTAPATQNQLTAHRNILLNYTPYPATIKALLAEYYDFPHWAVRPPLVGLPDKTKRQVLQELALLD